MYLAVGVVGESEVGLVDALDDGAPTPAPLFPPALRYAGGEPGFDAAEKSALVLHVVGHLLRFC